MGLFFASLFSMAGLAILFATILAVADKKLRVEENPLVGEINRLLPGVNCGACGCLSCHDFAEHIVSDGLDPNLCRVVGQEEKEQLLELTGADGGDTAPIIALVCCAAENEKKEPIADYNGVKTCSAANLDFGGGMQCQYGCMGFGDCTWVCPFDAIHMVNGLPKVDVEKCTGCGQCATACPRDIIKMQQADYDSLFYVACSSKDGALRVRQVCGVGCIGCGICVKLAQGEDYFAIEDNLSVANYAKQKEADAIRPLAEKCPTKVIKEIQ